ncbi:hypothetical protein FOZ62_029799 [Perkinsus olseni]|nr:hypothetical protein FOZ62_029799 [Perkinsus olseni]
MKFSKRSEDGRLRTDRVECSGGNGGQVVSWTPVEGVACMDDKVCFEDPIWAMNIQIPQGTSNTRETFSQKMFLKVFKGSTTGDLSCNSLRKQLCSLYKDAAWRHPVKSVIEEVNEEDSGKAHQGQTTASQAPSPVAAANLDQLVHHRRPARYNFPRQPKSASMSDTFQDTSKLSSYESNV